MDIYIICGESGEWDDYRKWVTPYAYASKDKAKARAGFMQRNISRLQSLPEYEDELNNLEDGRVSELINRIDPEADRSSYYKVSYSIEKLELKDE